jgi:D-xylose transport system substrate-binding protein
MFMGLKFGRHNAYRTLLGVSVVVTLLAGCGGSSSSSGGGSGTFSAAKGCKHVAFLLPESATAARWEAADHPLVEAAVKAALPGVTIDTLNAQGSADQQLTQANSELTKKACIMVVAPKDSTAASAIVQKAKADKVPVIAYDRLIQDNDLAYYVSFDGVAVGKLQGQYIADHHQKGDNVAMINGSQTDNNAKLFAQGAHQVLDPLFNSGELKKVYEQFTPDWSNDTAQTEMQAALTQNQNNIQIAYVANDGMANTVIAALRAQKLNGKTLVTGQDAEVSGVRNILLGDQSMTVYKPIKKLADATAKLVAALSNGSDTASIASAKIQTDKGANIPSILNDVVSVDIKNVKDTVIADGFVKKEDVCQGVPAGAGGVC